MNSFKQAAEGRAAERAAQGKIDDQRQAERGQYARSIAEELKSYLAQDPVHAGKFDLAIEKNIVSLTKKGSGDPIRITALDRDVYSVKCNSAVADSLSKNAMTRMVVDWLDGDVGHEDR